MKKSLYRKVIIGLLIIFIIITIIIAIKINAFSTFKHFTIMQIVIKMLTNNYVCNILCGFFTIVLIYNIQIKYSKHKLKTDNRCNEIIEDIYDSINEYNKFVLKIPVKEERTKKQDIIEYYHNYGNIMLDFYKENKEDIYSITLGLSYFNNDILIQSVESCFFINLNFKLLSIINNIKNRLPNLRNGYTEVECMVKEYEEKNDKDILLKLGNEIYTYCMDLKFMVEYWSDLLDYLGFDPTYMNTYYSCFNDKYKIEEYYKLSLQEQHNIHKAIRKEVNNKLRKDLLKNFWKD